MIIHCYDCGKPQESKEEVITTKITKRTRKVHRIFCCGGYTTAHI